ncbi:hypothetical protein KIN20_034334 [Parelaphostrongylus tenuis]|uniref:Uncharacterized protein n=1 Tax=Parelaphostrongylus tenuis TaxID=148309 RepID=A0AAD5RA76_PARTN|nr:hypothetical protein KIN20_034334 [Parelaphostrongylus tenuis]
MHLSEVGTVRTRWAVESGRLVAEIVEEEMKAANVQNRNCVLKAKIVLLKNQL